MSGPSFSTRRGRSPLLRLTLFALFLTCLITFYTVLFEPTSQSFGIDEADVAPETPCSPRLWASGQWKPTPPRGPPIVRGPSDVLAHHGFDGCAADREYLWHLGAEPSEYHRYPDISSYRWTPPDTCDIRPFEKESLVKELVEGGGWLLIGDSVTEGHFFSLSCLLYPHVIATPNYTQNPIWDRAWPQNLYLNPKSPLVPSLHPPPGFNISITPLVTFRRVDLMLTQDQLIHLHSKLRPEIANDESFTLFGGDAVWEVPPSEYLGMLTTPLPDANYQTMIASTAGHWTTGTFPGLRDSSMFADGLQNVIDFFEVVMPVWAQLVQSWLYSDQTGLDMGRTAGGRKRQVVVRAYLPGHDGCHDIHHAWETYEQGGRHLSFNWGEIGMFNDAFERVLARPEYPDIHFLPIDRPALLRPDTHAGTDCLHIVSGPGVIEGWTHYIWHYITREIGLDDPWKDYVSSS